jgi:hypothetical protein
MSKIKVNSISNRLDEGPPELSNGAILPSESSLTVSGGLNLTGISTVGDISATNIDASTVTASSFVGDGSQLTGLPTVSQSKIIALKIIMDPLPFRA